MSTIFISHSSVDNALAVELLDWLKSQGYQSVFLDLDPDEGIEAGEHWEKVLYRELVSCSVVLALVTENWLASKWCFAEATHARSDGKTILGLTADRGVQPAILADTQSIDYSPDNRTDAYQRLAEALRRAIDPQGLGRWDPTRPLFPGLLFYDEQDAPIFFGRRRLGRAIYQKLRELQAKPPGSERLLLVFGPSGSGKSSVVRAGTLPHVHASPDAWITLGPFRPTEGWPEPLRQCMDVLTGTDDEAIAAKLREITDQLRSESKASKPVILLIIDQLEEALDVKDGAEAAFWLPLSRLLAPNETPFMAMATLRSDFMGDFQKRSARNLVRFGSFPIEPMSPEDLREVIAGPCRVAGIAIEPGLIDALVEDAGDEQALPLLALALNRLWLRYEAKQGSFTVADYRDGLGGMRGLIDREAESTLAGKGLREASVLDAFLSLTRQVREGVLARQPTSWDGLETEAQKSLEPFIGARLLVRYSIDGDKSGTSEENGTVVIDLIHETLLSGWQRLHNWVSRPENRDFLPWREELRHKVSRWSQTNEPKALLLEGAELKEAKKWLKAKRLALNTKEAAYIQAGIDAHKISRVKLVVAAAVLAAMGIGWWGWTRTDIYQIRAVEGALPELMRSAVASGYDKTLYIVELTQITGLGHTKLALTAAEKIDDAQLKATALKGIAQALTKVGQTQLAIHTFEQALAAADKIDDAESRADALRNIAETLMEADETQQAAEAFEHALAAADKIGHVERKTNALQEIAKALAEVGQTQQALTAANKIAVKESKEYTLRDIAIALAESGQTQQALATADKIGDSRWKTDALQEIAKALVEAGQTQEALAATDKIDNPGPKAGALEQIVKVLARAGHTEQALTAADKINEAERNAKGRALEEIAEALAKAGQTEQALIAADKINEAERNAKAGALQEIAKALAKAGQTQRAVQAFEQALTAANRIAVKEGKEYTLRDIAIALAESGQTQQAIATADKVNDAELRVHTLQEIAKTLAKAGQTQPAIQASERALAAADKFSNAQRAYVLRENAELLAETGLTQQAFTAAVKIDDAEQKAYALRAIAEALAKAGQSEQAVQAFEQVLAAADESNNFPTKTWLQADAFRAITTVLAEDGQYQQALAAAEKIGDAERKTNALQEIAKALIKAGQGQQALAAADKIDDAESRADALRNVAEALMEADETQQAAEAFEHALAAADKIGHVERKTNALYNIAKALIKTGQGQQALGVADKIDYRDHQYRNEKAYALQEIAKALTKAGHTQLAVAATEKIDDPEQEASALWEVANALADKGMKEQANPVLDKAVRITENISDEKVKSNTYGKIAAIYAQLAQYYPARITAEKAKFAGDTLNGYMAILKYYAIEKHPELAEKLAKLEKEDKR